MLETPFPLPATVFITEQLARRRPGMANHLEEKRAIQQLAASMIDQPEAVLPEFVALAMKLTDGVSAGLSLLEVDKGLPGIFRWHDVVGRLSAFEGATTPRQYSPCGVTLDACGPVLTRHAETLYTWIADARIVVPEVLLVPLYVGGTTPLGTLWVVSDDEGHFNSEHARIATELAAFVGIALQIRKTNLRLRDALDQQETLTREMNHRVKNVFAMADSMVRMTFRGGGSKEEIAASLSGRLRALADAHELVLRQTKANTAFASDLSQLVRAILRPHEQAGGANIVTDGPLLNCGERAVNGLALVLHELATNAVKYGALGANAGRVEVTWTIVGERLELRWREFGGASPGVAPDGQGFGSKLIAMTVARQFNGSISYRWEAAGLEAAVSVPLASLAN